MEASERTSTQEKRRDPLASPSTSSLGFRSWRTLRPYQPTPGRNSCTTDCNALATLCSTILEIGVLSLRGLAPAPATFSKCRSPNIQFFEALLENVYAVWKCSLPAAIANRRLLIFPKRDANVPNREGRAAQKWRPPRIPFKKKNLIPRPPWSR